MRAAGIVGIGVAVGCGATPPGSPPAAPPSRASAPVPAPAPAPGGPAPPPSASSVEVAPARLEALRAVADGPAHVEILFPFAEQRIPIPKAPGYRVRTTVEGWPTAPTGRGVLVALDQHRPRRLVGGAELRLGALLDEGRELAPGPHWLALAAVDETSTLVRGNGGSRAPFALVRFWVGESAPDRAPASFVSLMSPAGTYNGTAATRGITVDFLAAPARLGPGGARVRVTGAGVALEQRLDGWQPLTLRDLPSGDFRVEVELLDAQGIAEPGGRSARTITVNRELGP